MDYAAFFHAGIPFGGLFTEAEGITTGAHAVIYGGTAGNQSDPRHHLACDTDSNVSLELLDLTAEAIAASTLQSGMCTEAVNAVRGEGNFNPPQSSRNAHGQTLCKDR